jgi:hypothetical protein
VINGTFSIINAQFNVYRVQYTYSNCQGADAMLNGATFRGLASLDSGSPEGLIVVAQGQAGTTGIAVINLLERT